jgi:hypothetical protein
VIDMGSVLSIGSERELEVAEAGEHGEEHGDGEDEEHDRSHH